MMIQPGVEKLVNDMFAQSVLTWDEGVNLGIMLRQEIDSNSWNLGWLCCYMHKDDAQSLSLYAAAINEAYGTLNRLRWVASGFTEDVVASYPSLSFSHFEKVRFLIGKRDGDGDAEALALLGQAADNNWSAAELERRAKGINDDDTSQMSFPRFMAVGTRGVRIETVGSDRGIFIPLDNDPELYALVQGQFEKFLEYGPEIVEVTVRLAKP